MEVSDFLTLLDMTNVLYYLLIFWLSSGRLSFLYRGEHTVTAYSRWGRTINEHFFIHVS